MVGRSTAPGEHEEPADLCPIITLCFVHKSHHTLPGHWANAHCVLAPSYPEPTVTHCSLPSDCSTYSDGSRQFAEAQSFLDPPAGASVHLGPCG